MSDTPQVDTLAKFGQTFQSKVIAAMLHSPEFLNQSFDIISPSYFEEEPSQWIVKTTMQYFHDYKRLPTMEVFKVELKDVRDDTLKAGVVDSLRTVYQRIDDSDLQYVRDSFLDFARNQTLKTAILKSVDVLQTGDYGKIKTIIDSALRAGQPKNVGHDWKRDIDLRLVKSARECVSTGWDIIDSLTGGGLAAGELGVIAAPSGIGKSWALATLGANALKMG